MADCTFTVIGNAAAQGSKTAFIRDGRAVVVDGANKAARDKHAQWRGDVTYAARIALQALSGPFTGPIKVRMDFRLALPKSDPHRSLHFTTPDADKLARNVGDGLVNAGLIHDDSLICELIVTKTYSRDGLGTGCDVSITDLSALEVMYRERSKEAAREAKRAKAS